MSVGDSVTDALVSLARKGGTGTAWASLGATNRRLRRGSHALEKSCSGGSLHSRLHAARVHQSQYRLRRCRYAAGDSQKRETWTATLRPQAGATLAGSARVQALGEQTTVTIQLQNATAEAMHPWHGHEGTCGSGGPTCGAPTAYSPLQVGVSARTQGNAALAVTLKDARAYHVNVHAPPVDLATIVAYGDLDD